ncbi:hypothetical protein K3G63_02640 [Hymenobacter sp. HSC-4F20]|uniref:hypothetical protein n=1 Tax=Hymenobacter sp. HSC-4F20 TaxID=2864135 RepID=UPI001C72D478|nr:hypothetical protein [Hymenobacter sp. HSC-4F20]MBX0289316.1 hypothetical protein [Hymenobacter sp. HSC-4F20]
MQGRPLFEAFPDYPFPGATGKEMLLASLQQVLHTGRPHRLPLQRYEEQYRDILNTPVLTSAGVVSYVLHRAERAPAAAKPAPTPPLPSPQRESLYQLFENTPALICILLTLPARLTGGRRSGRRGGGGRGDGAGAGPPAAYPCLTRPVAEGKAGTAGVEYVSSVLPSPVGS